MAGEKGATALRNPEQPAAHAVAARMYFSKQGRYAFLPGLAPIFILYGLLLVAPMLLLGRYSFYRMSPGSVAVQSEWSLDSFVRFFSDLFYLRILAETLLVGLVVVAICVVLSYPLAYVM